VSKLCNAGNPVCVTVRYNRRTILIHGKTTFNSEFINASISIIMSILQVNLGTSTPWFLFSTYGTSCTGSFYGSDVLTVTEPTISMYRIIIIITRKMHGKA